MKSEVNILSGVDKNIFYSVLLYSHDIMALELDWKKEA